ncbi:Auxin efflux carrier component 2 [Glycine soja]|uniref:Auxin efflux carrier component 2 n=1 Tax=Glycine soja TaxID=3848 RepID=A0A445IXG7_GLYSO|nr:Auxin efflux carrier component 2 [Glycine soja]
MQTLTTSSTMAAEFVACYEASNHGIWLTNFVTGLQIVEGIKRPLKLYCDNKSVVLYSNNNRSSTKSKHIDIKFLIVKERTNSLRLAGAISTLSVDSNVGSLNGREPLQTDVEIGENGQLHVLVRTMQSRSMSMASPRASNLTRVEIYSVPSSRDSGSSFRGTNLQPPTSTTLQGGGGFEE